MLGAITDEPGRITRSFHSPAMQRVNKEVSKWMATTGLEVREDAAFNLIGRWQSANRAAKTFLLGSHLDTVRDAGKYDGVLGVMIALAAVQRVLRENVRLPFHVEIIGFSDEEGLRYQTTYLGSRAMAGTLKRSDLERIEEKGLERAKRDPRELLGYAEVHIEQGPVLETRGVGIGVVTAIAGQTRVRAEFRGCARHAGTTPIELRHDALCGAAEMILAAEKSGVTATVGQIEIEPGATNVIPGRATFSLDIRHHDDRRRRAACAVLKQKIAKIAKKRRLQFTWEQVQETGTVKCDQSLTRLMREAVRRNERELLELPSGAGHDAAAMSALCPVTMMFVRCKGGISHHPDESVNQSDVAKAIDATADFLKLLARTQTAKSFHREGEPSVATAEMTEHFPPEGCALSQPRT
jgi:allantoate deiminase